MLGIFDLQKIIFRYIFVDIGHNIFFTFSNTFQNQFQLAHGQQQTSIEIDPKDKQAWVNKGDALNRKGNFNALDGKGWSLNELVTIHKPSLILTKFLK